VETGKVVFRKSSTPCLSCWESMDGIIYPCH
jgi:hypothetical protein